YSGLAGAWLIYWLGDATGVLLVTPLALRFKDLLNLRDRNRLTKLGIFLSLLVVAAFTLFSDLLPIPGELDDMAFAILPFIIWVAVRFGVAATSLSILIVATIATVETALGSGPFASHSTFANAILLDVFYTILSVTGLSLAVAITEREHAERKRE